MDANVLHSLATLIRSNRLAALGTLRDGCPFVSMVVYAISDDLTSFYLHLSRLAVHTRDIIADPRLKLVDQRNRSWRIRSTNPRPRLDSRGCRHRF